MNFRAVLSDPQVVPSIAWEAVGKACGLDVDLWEPDTFRIELKRRGVEPTDGVMAKLLAAQTVHTTNRFAYDHDALFAFALACDGVPAAGDSFHHPTVDQLAWAMHEVDRLALHPMSEDAGFDPDEIDPAVAMVLLDEGFVQAPEELAFCQNILDHYGYADPVLRGEVATAWSECEHATLEALHSKLQDRTDDAVGVQLCRLADVRRFVGEREGLRDHQRRSL